jgi:antitoxin VapB
VVAIIDIYQNRERSIAMTTTAKLFQSGRSQAVRLPKALRFEGEEVIARRFGNGVLLLPMDAPWQLLREAVDEFEPGFELQREQPSQQPRQAWPE